MKPPPPTPFQIKTRLLELNDIPNRSALFLQVDSFRSQTPCLKSAVKDDAFSCRRILTPCCSRTLNSWPSPVTVSSSWTLFIKIKNAITSKALQPWHQQSAVALFPEKQRWSRPRLELFLGTLILFGLLPFFVSTSP